MSRTPRLLALSRVLGHLARGAREQLGAQLRTHGTQAGTAAREGAAASAAGAGTQLGAGAAPRAGGRELTLRAWHIAGLVIGSALLGSQANRCLDELELPARAGEVARELPGVGWLQQLYHGYVRSFQAHSQQSQPEAAAQQPAPPAGPALNPYFIADAAASAAPAVVNIMVHSNGMYPTGSSGSGFIVDGDGTILTNAHVVADAIHGGTGPRGAVGGAPGMPQAKRITVTLQDGRIFNATLINYDTVSDLAVVKVDSDMPLPTVKLGTSAGLRVGEWVVALGSPLHLQNSVTAGIVSCVDRKATELGLAGARTDYIQTDAAINKGNSGGPLVNLRGEVVGISAMKAVAADGVSFAIPVDTAIDVMRQLRTFGRVIRPYAGMKMLQLNRHNAAEFRRRDPNFPQVAAGILVPSVHAGSPAEKAGLKPGDIIVGFAGSNAEATTSNLVKALGEHIGKPMSLRVVRPGNLETTLSITAQEAGDGHH